MQKVTHKEARKRYRRIMWPAMIVYLAAILGGSFWLKQFESAPLWAGLLVTVAVSLPVMIVMFLLVRYFSETDEYNRMLHLKAFAYGASTTMSAIFFVGVPTPKEPLAIDRGLQKVRLSVKDRGIVQPWGIHL